MGSSSQNILLVQVLQKGVWAVQVLGKNLKELKFAKVFPFAVGHERLPSCLIIRRGDWYSATTLGSRLPFFIEGRR